MKLKIILLLVLILTFSLSAQEEQPEEKSNIITYTPSKLLNQGQWDIKWFNNLYTQTKDSEQAEKQPRETYFTSTIDIFTGISKTNNFNVGLLFEIRSNAVNDLAVLRYSNLKTTRLIAHELGSHLLPQQ
ncbi:MAG: hypothetical protein P8H44_02230 [Flavobacteriaceae bacterium]|jgi:hypothetical protein|nr:hypothetical protein [Flavobacteriaceae bacterium]